MINLDSTLFIQIINFIIIVIISKYLIFDPIINNIEKRQYKIADLKKAIDVLKSSIDKLDNEYKEKIDTVKIRNIKEMQASLNKIKSELDEKITDEKNKLKNEYANSLKNIINEYKKTEQELTKKLDVLSNAVVEKIL